jgi:hypothetical protein
MRNQLVIHHHDGNISFDVDDAIFVRSPLDGFSCTLRCKENVEHGYLTSPLFGLLSLPVSAAPVTGQRLLLPDENIELKAGMPSMHFYAGTHLSLWNLEMALLSVSANSLEMHGRFIVDDPLYYNHLAKATPVSFNATFKAGSASELWRP